MDSSNKIGGDGCTSKVFVLHSNEEADVARNMKEELIKRGFINTSIYLDDVLPGSSSVLEISNAIYKSHRSVMIISRNFIDDGCLHSGFLWAMDHQNTQRIISCFPVLYELQVNDLPIEFRHFEYYEYDDDLYQTLEEKIRNDIKIETRVTHTGVGLAWSYFYGYLDITLPGLESRINKCAQFKDTLYPKLVIIVPVSCKCPDVMPEKENFRHVGKIDHEVSRAGVHERSYKSTVYDFNFTRNSNNEHVHCSLLIEFATPLLSLHDMNKDKIAQLNKEQMTNERHVFKEVVSQILNYESMKKCRDKYLLIDYRDEDEQTTTSLTWKKETLSEVVARAVENDMIAHNCAERYLRPVDSVESTTATLDWSILEMCIVQ